VIEKLAQAIDNGEPEAETGPPVTVWFAKSIELAKNVLMLILRNPDTSVPHLDPQLSISPSATDDEAAVRRITHRIGHEIE
jgi:hypothetical protein